MTDDESARSAGEEKATAALHRALHEIAAEHPVRIDAAALASRPRMRRPASPSLRLALAVVAVVAVAAASLTMAAYSSWPKRSPTTIPSLLGSTAPTPHLAPAGWEATLEVSRTFDPGESHGGGGQFGSADQGVVLLVGFSHGSDWTTGLRWTLYRSFDGRTWSESEVPNPNGAQNVESVACRGWVCIVVWGPVLTASAPPTWDGRMAVTFDGRTWQQEPLPNGRQRAQVVAGRDRFVMTDSASMSSPLLESANGRDWFPVDWAPGSPPITDAYVQYDQDSGQWLATGYFAAEVRSSGRVSVATSPDGIVWTDALDAPGLGDLWKSSFSGTAMTTSGVCSVHLGNRWFVYVESATSPRFRPDHPTPMAVWGTVYWLDDGGGELHTASPTTALLPDVAVSMGSFLVGSNVDESAYLVSSDGFAWTRSGVAWPAEDGHGTMRALTPLARAGSGVVTLATALESSRGVWKITVCFITPRAP